MSAPRFHPWLLDTFACPACGGGLDTDPRGVLRCGSCSSLYPVLAGVPVLVPAPDRWVAGYREPILATLAEHGLIDDAVLEMVSIFADAGGTPQPQRWADDWVPCEEWDEPWPEAPDPGFAGFLDGVRDGQPQALLVRELGEVGRCVEFGVGAGSLSVELAGRARELIVADTSLRAVLSAFHRVAEAGAEACAVVADAELVRLRQDSVDAVVAANVIDLLDYPDHLVAEAAAGLRPRGALALTTPDPGLGDPDAEDAVDALLAEHGFESAWSRDYVPWIRPHRAREWQVFFVRALVARRSPG